MLKKTFLIIPPSGSKNFFNGPWGYFKLLLKNKGVQLKLYAKEYIQTSEMIIFFNYHKKQYKECKSAGINKQKLVLILYEPQVVQSSMYTKIIIKRFGLICTWRDDFIHKENHYKIRYIQGQHYRNNLPGFSERRFLTLINVNKCSYEKNELYTLRRKAIKFFENQDIEFELYGYNWDKRIIYSIKEYLRKLRNAIDNWMLLKFFIDTKILLFPNTYKSYKGRILDKYEILQNYKFCVCFENEKSPGYITEKIFDCFFTGTIPIYFGATNIEKYIPETCYVDFRNYSSFNECLKYLKNMTREEMHEMQN